MVESTLNTDSPAAQIQETVAPQQTEGITKLVETSLNRIRPTGSAHETNEEVEHTTEMGGEDHFDADNASERTNSAFEQNEKDSTTELYK